MLIPSPPLLCLELAEDEKIVYRGEGNSSLVVALKRDRKVIRLLKADSKQLKNKSTKEDIYSILRSHIEFNETVVKDIISESFFSCPQLIKLSESQIKTISRLVRDKRPSFRLGKDISCSEDTYALLLPDYCCLPPLTPPSLLMRSINTRYSTIGPVIAVEIKPKQGFLPDPNIVSLELEPKARICRYCLSQFHKSLKGSIRRRSRYCPLDLFSFCPQRMMSSLLALIDNPQNNLRIFRDIQLAYGEDTCSDLTHVLSDFIIDCDLEQKSITFCRLLAKALTLSVDRKSTKDSDVTNTTNKVEVEVGGEVGVAMGVVEQRYCSLHTNNTCRHTNGHFMSFGSVLQTILFAQKLDSIDSQLANDMSDWIRSQMTLEDHQLEDQQDNNNNNGNDDLHKKSPLAVPIVRLVNEPKRLFGESKLDFYSRKVWQFLVSLTAKDCSIMIAMQRLVGHYDVTTSDVNNVIVDEITGNKYLVSIRVTDLDPKPAHKIKRTLSNDQRMIRAFNAIYRSNNQSIDH